MQQFTGSRDGFPCEAHGEVRRQAATLAARPFSLQTQPLSGPDGAVLGALVVATDLSEPG